MSSRGRGSTDKRLLARLPELWALGVEVSDIAERYGVAINTVLNHAKRLRLPLRLRPLMYSRVNASPGEGKRRHAAMLGCLHHRNAIRQPDPVVLLPSPTLFGAPLKQLDPETRALIDSAVRGG